MSRTVIGDLAIAAYALTEVGQLITSKRKQFHYVQCVRAGLYALANAAEVLGGLELFDRGVQQLKKERP